MGVRRRLDGRECAGCTVEVPARRIVAGAGDEREAPLDRDLEPALPVVGDLEVEYLQRVPNVGSTDCGEEGHRQQVDERVSA